MMNDDRARGPNHPTLFFFLGNHHSSLTHFHLSQNFAIAKRKRAASNNTIIIMQFTNTLLLVLSFWGSAQANEDPHHKQWSKTYHNLEKIVRRVPDDRKYDLDVNWQNNDLPVDNACSKEEKEAMTTKLLAILRGVGTKQEWMDAAASKSLDNEHTRKLLEAPKQDDRLLSYYACWMGLIYCQQQLAVNCMDDEGVENGFCKNDGFCVAATEVKAEHCDCSNSTGFENVASDFWPADCAARRRNLMEEVVVKTAPAGLKVALERQCSSVLSLIAETSEFESQQCQEAVKGAVCTIQDATPKKMA
jgi:hypothetical protein